MTTGIEALQGRTALSQQPSTKKESVNLQEVMKQKGLSDQQISFINSNHTLNKFFDNNKSLLDNISMNMGFALISEEFLQSLDLVSSNESLAIIDGLVELLILSENEQDNKSESFSLARMDLTLKKIDIMLNNKVKFNDIKDELAKIDPRTPAHKKFILNHGNEKEYKHYIESNSFLIGY
jgi:hypothetical protein